MNFEEDLKGAFYSNISKLLRDFSLLCFNTFLLIALLVNYSDLVSLMPPISFVCVLGALITTGFILFQLVQIILNRILYIKCLNKLYKSAKKLDE